METPSERATRISKVLAEEIQEACVKSGGRCTDNARNLWDATIALVLTREFEKAEREVSDSAFEMSGN